MNEDDEDNNFDEESQGTHAGYCRGCNQMKYDLSNGDGYCGDCN